MCVLSLLLADAAADNRDVRDESAKRQVCGTENQILHGRCIRSRKVACKVVDHARW